MGRKLYANGSNIHLKDSASSKVVEFGLYGKATQDGEPTPDNPIEIVVSGSDGSVEVVSCGKNLLENTASTMDRLGITFTVNDDGSVTASGTATDRSAITVKDKVYLKKVGAYKLSGCPNGGSETTYRLLFGIKKADGTFIADIIDYGNGASFSITQEMIDSKVYGVALIYVFSGYTANNLTFKPMIRLASDTDATYEPYKETTSTIPTPNGIAGIKVSSGGNYTDENGQQWICDEVVKYADGSGKRIQRIGKAVFDGSADEGWYIDGRGRWITFSLSEEGVNIENINKSANALCTSYQIKPPAQTYEQIMGVAVNNKTVIVYDSNHSGSDKASWTAYLAENPMILYYELATPIITDLTAEEIAEIEKLHTFYPITNIYNDAECGMEITYISTLLEFIEPKTDWTSKDSFDYVAYNRVSGNILFLKELADDLFGNLTELSLETEKENLSLIYARHMNAIEDGLDRLNIETYKKNIGDKKTYYPNKNVPDADEYNRIENACLMLYEALQAHKRNLPRLAFRLGNQKGIRV